jgi:hypothetical protein
MFCNSLLKIIRMTGVVGSIGTTQNIHPKAHISIASHFLASLNSGKASPTCHLPFDSPFTLRLSYYTVHPEALEG